MRTILAYAFTHDAPTPNDTATVHTAVERWLTESLGMPPAAFGDAARARPEAPDLTLHLETRRFESATGILEQWRLRTRHADGRVARATVGLGSTSDSTTLFAGVEAHGWPPLYGHHDVLGVPELVASALGQTEGWRRSGREVAREAVALTGARGGRQLVQYLFAGGRSCPVVVVAADEAMPKLDALVAQLAQRLVGAATVIAADARARAELNAALGSRLACHRDQVRVYRPGLQAHDPAAVHPFWRPFRIGTAGAGADRTMAHVEALVFEQAAYTVDEPPGFERMRAAHSQRELVAIKADGDLEKLAGWYAAENTQLQHRLDQANLELDLARLAAADLEAECATHRANMALLGRPIGETPAPGAAPVEADDAESSADPANVSEALALARAELAEGLLWGDEVDAQVARLAPQAGPPRKVLGHLQALGELARLKRLGDAVDGGDRLWLQRRNVENGGEDTADMRNTSYAQARTWSVAGVPRTFTAHTKLNERTHPDKCVRIYYAWDAGLNRLVVGSVGPHP